MDPREGAPLAALAQLFSVASASGLIAHQLLIPRAGEGRSGQGSEAGREARAIGPPLWGVRGCPAEKEGVKNQKNPGGRVGVWVKPAERERMRREVGGGSAEEEEGRNRRKKREERKEKRIEGRAGRKKE